MTASASALRRSSVDGLRGFACPADHAFSRKLMLWAIRGIVGAMLAVVSFLLYAADAQAQASAPSATGATSADLTLMDRPIATFRASLSGATPEQRARRTQAVLEGLSERTLELPTQTIHGSLGEQRGVIFRRGDRILFALLQDDVDPADTRPFDDVAAETQSRLDAALAARRAQLHWPNIVRGILYSVLATVILVAAIWLIGRMQTWLQARIQYAVEAHVLRRTAKSFDWTGSAFHLARQIVQLMSLFLAAALIYLYLIVVLERFPASEPMGARLSGFLWSLANDIASAIVNAIPGIITVVVIFLLTRALQNLLDNVFRAVQQRNLTIPGLHPDTAGATRRIVSIVVWALALTFAYPYLPGAQSDVFKGLSVLLGLMVTLGSSGIVNQLMSGIVVTYSRAFHKGDMVKIGDLTGTVVSVDTLSVKLTNVRQEEVTIPNAVVVGSVVCNYSNREGKPPAFLTASVTIGYDTPWRQVQVMLALAAARTRQTLDTPPPFVLQQALSDFYIEYALHVAVADPNLRPVILSELHSHIVDVFNEYDVQIMSPHFMGQPAANVVVPREGWYAAPATSPEESGNAQAIQNAPPFGPADNSSRR
jgi:small-conductance mechanosensitive channel